MALNVCCLFLMYYCITNFIETKDKAKPVERQVRKTMGLKRDSRVALEEGSPAIFLHDDFVAGRHYEKCSLSSSAIHGKLNKA